MKINDDVIKVIIEQAKKDAPIESCGLLLGKNDVVTESYWMENIDHSEEHFAFAPKDQFAALKSGNPVAMAAGYETLKQLGEPDVYELLEEQPGAFRPLFPQYA